MNSLLDVIKRERPDYLAVCFDKEAPFHALNYLKTISQSRWNPEAIRIAVPFIQQILKNMHIPVVEMAGYEADDIIGTLAKQAEKGFSNFYGYQIKISPNWFQRIFSCIVLLEWGMVLKYGGFQKYKLNLK